ncbi:hypothetical protein HJG60_007798 [Phyllostomus discolor]|uniref:Uncharacterized protein n=1 Tax=Phyllostomus discolor TaxID=89673 RepID=A0A834BML9_9CHIR|nr:hypothetical protein HJG60_007798 [Phyllostomus discolor]
MLGRFQSPLISLPFLETQDKGQAPSYCQCTADRRVGPGRPLAPHSPQPGTCPPVRAWPTPASHIGLHLACRPTAQPPLPYLSTAAPPFRLGPCWRGLPPGWGDPVLPGAFEKCPTWSRAAPRLPACLPPPQMLLEAKCLSAALHPPGTWVRDMDFPWLLPLKECARMLNLLVTHAVTVP